MAASFHDSKGGFIPGIGRDHILQRIFPLPPLAEQKEIVKQMNKLMDMIDVLEKLVLDHRKQSEMLMKSVLKEAFEGKSAATYEKVGAL